MSKPKEKSDVAAEAGEPLLERSDKIGTVINATDETRSKFPPTEVKRNKSKCCTLISFNKTFKINLFGIENYDFQNNI